MSNSPLVVYTQISPNRTSPRNAPIDRITPHCVVGQCTAETLGGIFAPTSRQASSNYGIDKDARVGMYCEEKDRSWCSSSGANDHRAITIECASDTTKPWAFKQIVYDKLIELCVDICKRNGKNVLLWIEDKEKALSYSLKSNEMLLTAHCWFAATACPGDWMLERMGDLATKVTAKLSGESQPSTELDEFYRVQIGAYGQLKYAEDCLARAKAAGFDDAFITKVKKTSTETQTPVETPKTIQVGSRVKIKQGAKSYSGQTLASFVYGNVYTVDVLSGDRAVLDKTGICTAVNVNDLILQD